MGWGFGSSGSWGPATCSSCRSQSQQSLHAPHFSQRWFAHDAIQCGPCQHTDGIEADIAPKLKPYIPPYIVAYRCVESRLNKCAAQQQYALGPTTVGLTDDEPTKLVMRYDARRNDFARWLYHTAYRPARLYAVP